jgi:hypothetical protein
MKTIKKGLEYKRVNETEAEAFVSVKGWKYCPKNEWKTNIRDFNKKQVIETAVVTETTIAEPKPKKTKKNGK